MTVQNSPADIRTARLRPPFGPSWIAFAAWVAAVILVNVPNFVYPFFEDSAIFAAVGRWMHAGLLPDRDLLDMKPPGVHWVAYITYALFGTSALGSRAVELFFILATAIACGRITERSESAPGGWTALLCGILSSGALWGLPERGQVEFYQSAILAWGCCLVIEGGPTVRVRVIAASGFLLAMAAWFKPQAALLGILLAIALTVMLLRRHGLRQTARGVAALAAGAGAISAVFAGWLWATGALRPFLDTMLVINRDYVSLRGSPGLVQALLAVRPDVLSTPATIVTAIFVGAGLVTSLRRSEGARAAWPRLVLELWLIVAFVQFWSGGQLFNYHKIIGVAPVACLAAQGSWALSRWLAAWLPAAIGPARAALAGLVLAVYVLSLTATPKVLVESRALSRWITGTASFADIHCQFGKELHYYDYCAQLSAARYVRDRTQPGETVQAIGIGAAFYLNADRPPATRFVLASLALDPRFRGKPRRLREFMTALLRRPPAYIMVRTNDYFPWFGLPSGLLMVEGEPELFAFVRQRYVPEGEVSPGFLAFRRR
jgi:hypothetical protein